MPAAPSAASEAGPPVLGFSDRRRDDFAVTTPDGVVARMDVAMMTSRCTVTHPDGRTGEIVGQPFQRDWEMTGDGGTALRAVRDAGAWGFHPDAWTVQQDGSLTLAEFVATVETYRRVVQRRRSAG